MSPFASLRVLITLMLFYLLSETDGTDVPEICRPATLQPAITCGCVIYRPFYQGERIWRRLQTLCLRQLSGNSQSDESRCQSSPLSTDQGTSIIRADFFFRRTTRECVFSSSSSFSSFGGSIASASAQAFASGPHATASTQANTHASSSGFYSSSSSSSSAGLPRRRNSARKINPDSLSPAIRETRLSHYEKAPESDIPTQKTILSLNPDVRFQSRVIHHRLGNFCLTLAYARNIRPAKAFKICCPRQ